MIKQRGQIFIGVLIAGLVGVLIVTALAGWAVANITASRQAFNRELAIQIAEAGVDYYRWHLAHAPTDFQDGTGVPGPYTHDFYNKDGNIIGQFILNITPPPLGSSLVQVKSTGKVSTDPNVYRSILSVLAKPSFAKYAVAANANMRFGSGTEVFGPIHSNGGIRFDGLAHNIVTSALASYDDPDYDDCNNNNSFGVHTCKSPADPSPPAVTPSRPDVFEVGRQFPVPALDFAGITTDFAQIKSDAQSNGFYRAGSGKLGYHIVLKTNSTFDLYKVTKFTSAPGGCTNSNNQDGWSTWSIQNETLIGNYAFPANGLIFLEDDVFIDGQINNARLTIAAALFPDNPSTRKSITVNNNLKYTNYDGKDVLSLIAQRNINIGLVSLDNLQIDAALVAQNGRVGRYYYSSSCGSNYIRQIITLYGMIATNQRYGFAYTDGTGYQTRNINYDGNLLYGPPPSFPLTSDQYVIVSWQEVK